MNKRALIISSQVLLLLMVLGYFVYHTTTEVETTPCSPQGFPARCYHISQDICEVVWKKAESSCKGIISGLNLPPTRLIGPVMFKCQQVSLDNAFGNSRKSNDECSAMKADLESWKARNPDFR
jgi:hypothetical protein